MAARPFAAFDIDGTVLRWQMYHALNDALVRQGSIDPAAFQPVRDARMNWKRRAADDAFRDYEGKMVEVFDSELAKLTLTEFTTAIDHVFTEYKDQVYTYTRDLLRVLQAQGYLLLAISGSPSLIVERFARYYGFDDFVATDYPVKDGRFVGTKQLSLGHKSEILAALIRKHKPATTNSLAIGDTFGDREMLAMTEQPIAFNPDKKLFQYAKKQGWKIVVERKNMIYKLEQRNGSYVLA